MNEENKNPSEPEDIPELTEISADETVAELSDNAPLPKENSPKKISLVSFIISAICVALAAVMITYVCCLNVWKEKQIEKLVYVEKDIPNEFDVIFSEFFDKYSFEDLDKDEMLDTALRAYIYSTGDIYAEYYNAEEWEEMSDKSQAKSKGIGIHIIDSSINVDGVEYNVFITATYLQPFN